MRTISKIPAVCFCMLAALPLWAQIDESRMQRDLEISKNVLATLLNEGSSDFMKNSMLSERRIEASYVEGFGVVFKIPKRDMLFGFHGRNPGAHVVTNNGLQFDQGRSRVVIRSNVEGGESSGISVVTDEDLDEVEEIVEETMEEKENKEKNKSKSKDKTAGEKSVVKTYTYSFSDSGESNEDWEEDNEKFEEAVITFLADYADLINQLKPDDKILVKRDASNENIAFVWKDEDGEKTMEEYATGLSVTALKKDISDYKSGKIDRGEFEDRLQISEEKEKEKIADLEIFGSIFRQYFSSEFSKTFFTDSAPDYERLENMGVIFTARTYSSYKENDFYYLPALGQDKVNEKERTEKIEILYPKFLDDLKTFMVDYGRTIRSLEDDEKLVIKVEMTKCVDCTVPKFVEAVVPVSVIRSYDQQKITKEKAVSSIQIKEIK